MAITINEMEPANPEKKELTKTAMDSVIGRDGAISVTADILNKMSLPRLFLIMSLIIYGVISYSKGEEGVIERDLSIFIFFLINTILLFGLLTVLKKIYELNWNNCIRNFSLFIKTHYKIFLLLILILVWLFLFLYYIAPILDTTRSYITEIIGNFGKI